MPKALMRVVSVAATALVCYCLLGFLILPGVAQRIANQQLAQYATVPARVERIEFNPFSLELTLFNLRLGETEQEEVAFERLYLNLQWESLWRKALRLKDVELIRPQTQVRFDENGTLNLSQLFALPESTEEQPDDANTEPFALRIDRLLLADGSLRFQDLRPGEPIDFKLEQLNFELFNLSTVADDAANASLVAAGPNGARVEWEGQFGLMPITSTGQLSITDLALKDFWPYARDAVPLDLQEGKLSLATDYRLDLGEATELYLENTTGTVARLLIDSPDGAPLVSLEHLEIAQTSLDLAKQQVVIGQLRSQNLETWVTRDADGQLNWQRLLASQAGEATPPAPSLPETTDTTPEDTAPPPANAESSPWQVLLNDAQLRNYQIHLTDQVPEEPVELALGPLNLDLKNFDSLGTSPFDLRLDTGLGKQGRLLAEGQLQLSPVSGTLRIETSDIDLRVAQAYLTPFMHLELRSGLFSGTFDATLESTEPLALRIGGDAEITQLHTLDTINNRDFVKWQALRLNGLTYDHPNSLSIERADLNQPYARFIINPDLTTNINDLLVAQELESPSTPETPPAEPQPLAIRLGALNIADGSANFADFSLRPPFVTAIQELNGDIGALDNQQQKPASVDVQGKVDRYAPVSIKGSLTPFDPMQSLDIATSFKQVELTTLSPYSTKFAGYRIRKGRLNLDLHYRIQQGKLNADNKVVVEQLQLGEKVDSPDAVDLPVRLAVALLKDSKGTIAIELPVQGDLSNPQFSVMPIVWQTLRNLVVRAAQAPFKFLAGLAGGDQADLGKVLFAPASDELDSQAQQSLDALAIALKERPMLRLEVEGMSLAASDGPLLAEQWLQRAYQRSWYQVLQRRGDKVPANPEELEVEEDEKAALLEAIYRTELKAQPPAEWAELDDEIRFERMRLAVLEKRKASPTLLRLLSQARAASIKEYLVDRGALDASRIYLLDTGTAETEENGQVATVLHLGSE